MYHVSRVTSFLSHPLIDPVIRVSRWVVCEINLDLFAVWQFLTDESILDYVNILTACELSKLLKPYRHYIAFGYLLGFEFHWIVYTVKIKGCTCFLMGDL